MKNIFCKKRYNCNRTVKRYLKYVKRQVKATTDQKKDQYWVKLENLFASGTSKQMWHGMQMITGYKEKEKGICVVNKNRIANEMNICFARFETIDFFYERAVELETVNTENGNPITLHTEKV